ncbi:serine--tRNA ligase [Candidatus Woesearchaeota archaeon]|nr:serine--tRNA ligase [Candidatus Woesearchaeota archaeon]
MLDIHFIRENPDVIKKDLEKRNQKEKIKWLDDLLKKDREWREIKQKIDELRHKRNILSEKINQYKKEGKDIKPIIKEVKSIPEKIKKLEEKSSKLKEIMIDYLLKIPNVLHKSVPKGKDEEDNKEIKKFGKKPKFNFDVMGHSELMKKQGWADIERAAKTSGARWYFLKGELALLHRAVSSYGIDFMLKKGYNLVIPPFAINRDSYDGVISMADFEEMIYKIQDEDLYMIGTSEHPLISMYKNEILKEDDLPIKIVGFSTNFRKEAGSHGKDTKGIFRVHQFDKVEQIIISKPEDSWKLHEELIKNSIDFWKSLNIPFRQVLICTGEMGIVAAKKYDLEAWVPKQNKYREMVSCSNCTSYQAVRSNIRYSKEKEEGTKYVHTLNATLIPPPRALVPILENNQNKDGTVNIPKVLIPYMNGNKKIGKKIR